MLVLSHSAHLIMRLRAVPSDWHKMSQSHIAKFMLPSFNFHLLALQLALALNARSTMLTSFLNFSHELKLLVILPLASNKHMVL